MHTITVTRIAEDPNADTDDPEYTTGGEHDRSCSVWYPCKVEGCEADDEGAFHGEEHIVIYGEDKPCTQMVNECGLDFAYEYDNPEWQMTTLGTFNVDVDWDGDNWTARLFVPVTA